MTKRERQAFRGLYTAADEFSRVVEIPGDLQPHDDYRAAKIKLIDALVLAAEILPSDAPRPVVQNSATGERRSK